MPDVAPPELENNEPTFSINIPRRRRSERRIRQQYHKHPHPKVCRIIVVVEFISQRPFNSPYTQLLSDPICNMAEEDKDIMIRQLALTSRNDDDDPSESVEELIEITTYVREDQAWALEILGCLRQQNFGVNFDKATMIREALDLLIEKYDIRVAKWPDKRPGSAR